MKNKILDNYYKGNAINAYEFFGAHICEERDVYLSVIGHILTAADIGSVFLVLGCLVVAWFYIDRKSTRLNSSH